MAGIDRHDIGFTCVGQLRLPRRSDVRVRAELDAVGAWPPICESHVEMDGAWALYEAWVRLQHGDIDIALVFGSGQVVAGEARARSIRCSSTRTTSRRSASTRGRSPRCRRGRCSTRARPPSATWPRSSPAAARNAEGNPTRRSAGDFDVDELLAEPYVRAPLRAHDLPPITDGAVAVVLAARRQGRVSCASARRGSRGIDHRIEVALARHARPHRRRRRPRWRREGAGVGDGPGRGRRAVGARSRPRS